MSQLALQVENVSKMYRLGQVGTGTLSHDLNRLYARLLGKPDPYARLGAENDREQQGGEYVWALRDVSFEVKKGEILGIIGRNGAGKSTLLKLLSRVTAPTTGEIRLNGRVASLLEVGTGFHPELTGRENIYLNGAILGMTRAEIDRRFEEIVEFSGCAKYIDTPVKRYSSGMHVRLAFAVAAHLESDILIVDEVLAVGDQEFQNKCIGKLRRLGENEERTVLFVSHNMSSIKSLCPSSILMNRGYLTYLGRTDAVISRYLSAGSQSSLMPGDNFGHGRYVTLHSAVALRNCGEAAQSFATSDDIKVELNFTLHENIKNLRTILKIFTHDGIELLNTSDFSSNKPGITHVSGKYMSTCCIPGNLLNVGKYYAEITFDVPKSTLLLRPERVVEIPIELSSFDQTGITFDAGGQIGPPAGLIHPDLDWSTRRLN